MAWNSILLNGILSLIDMKQHIMTGTENANCCGNVRLRSARSFEATDPSNHVLSYTNPVIHSNTPDPGVTRLKDGSGWVAVATSDFATRANKSSAFPMYFSRDLVSWELRAMVFTPATWPHWAEDSMWAPELHNVNGRYIVYFTARETNGQLACGAAVAQTSDPFGPYLDIGRPLVQPEDSLGGAIDPHYFKDPLTDKDYLLWKEDKPLSLQPSIIYLSELAPSGVFLKSKPVVLLRSNFENILEERLIAEAPWLMYSQGYYYLFYSSAWTTEAKYHIRVAVSKKVAGPYSRGHAPVLTTDWGRYDKGMNCTFAGPGHGSVVEAGGDWWLVYHAWLYGRMNQDPGRMMLMDKVKWVDGWPMVGVPSDTPQPVPQQTNRWAGNVV